MIKVFISYGHHVTDVVAKRLVFDLRSQGDFDVFFDSDCLQRDDWEQQITAGIERCDFFVFCVSGKSVSPDGYCLNELSRACEIKKTILPICFDESFLPLSITRLQRIYFHRCLNPDNSFIEATYKTSYRLLVQLLRGEKKIGYYNKDISMEDQLQTFDPYEVAHYALDFQGREYFFKDFEEWLHNEDALPIFLLEADPGIGKTALCAALATRYSGCVAGIHFCVFNNSAKTNPKSIITSLACQLSYRDAHYAELLSSILKTGDKGESDAKRLFEMLILEPLSKCEFPSTQIFVIDALDEAILHGKNEIAQIIASTAPLLPKFLRFFVSTRPREDVVGYFQHSHKFVLDEESQENIEDLRKYYEKAFLPDVLDGESMNILMGKSHGSFLYAKVITSSVKAGELSLKRIEEFPDGVYSYYTMWFHRIFDDGEPPYEEARKILSLIAVTQTPPGIDFLSSASGLGETRVYHVIEALSSFLYIGEERVYARHKSVIDWLNNPAHCPSVFLLSHKDGYRMLYDYARKVRSLGRGWKRDPHVIRDYTRALRHLRLCDELCEVMQDHDFITACLKSSYYTLYEGFQEYFRCLSFLSEVDEDYCFDVFDSPSFVSIMGTYRMKIYNSGYFLELRSCSFEEYLTQKNSVGSLIGDNIEYELGVIQFFYISLLFDKAADRIEELLRKHPLGELDLNHRGEIERMMLLTYRKAAFFGRVEEVFPQAIKDARAAGSPFEESLDYLTLSKVYCRELRKQECYAAAEKAVGILHALVEEEKDERNSQMEDHLFLAEDYRVYADAAIWLDDMGLAERLLAKAEAIYNLYHVGDRYYPRFLYTSLFLEIARAGDKGRIDDLCLKLEETLSRSKDKYDKAQFEFLKALHAYVESKKEPTMSMKIEEPLGKALAMNTALKIPVERLENECLFNLYDDLSGSMRRYQNRYNQFTDRWIEYVETRFRSWREKA